METNELAKALAKAQGQMGHAVKDSLNPHFKNKYADLASVLDAIRKPFSENGLSVSQVIEGNELHTYLMHESGQFIVSKMPIIPQQNTPQAYGSALTYARRYSLSAIAGVTQDDDDGNAASKTHNPTEKPYSEEEKKQKLIEDILLEAESVGMGSDEITKALGIDDWRAMDGNQYKALKAEINKTKQAKTEGKK